jgi:hypothetical protein
MLPLLFQRVNSKPDRTPRDEVQDVWLEPGLSQNIGVNAFVVHRIS